ncbi:hypothetical protein THICB3600047 [Thiomonas sp. CB3]|nr:hypothetical protein THICB3600047 [Thiomonas sp. CB3]
MEHPGQFCVGITFKRGAIFVRHGQIGDCAIENTLRVASGLNFGAFQPAYGKPGAWLKSAPAPTQYLHGRSQR